MKLKCKYCGRTIEFKTSNKVKELFYKSAESNAKNTKKNNEPDTLFGDKILNCRCGNQLHIY